MKNWFLYIFIIIGFNAKAQLFTLNSNDGDAKKRIDILEYTGNYRFQKLDSVANLIMLAGNVKLRQGTSLLTCDSLAINTYTKIMEAFGNVHINESDTINTYANYIKYYGNSRKAELRKNVRIQDNRTSITNESFDYDMAAHIGTYNVPTRIVSGKSIVNSNKGVFYLDTKDLYFYDKVKVNDPKYNITTDTLFFNTNTQIARFVSPSIIIDDAGRYIKTSEGFYNAKSGRAEFGESPYIKDGDNEIKADNIKQDEQGNSIAEGNVWIKDNKNKVTIIADKTATDKATGIKQASGNVIFKDEKNGITIFAGNLNQNEKKGAYLATIKPVLLLVQDGDSVVITADSLFSARISDMKLFKAAKNIPVEKDTVNGLVVMDVSNLKSTDSSNRYFEAYRNVRIFHDSIQAVGDSCFYSLVDSTFRLFGNPVAWAQDNQICGDTMLVYTEKQKPSRIHVYENSFMINKLKDNYYNQIKSKTLNGYFVDGNINYMRAKGSAESIYVAQDKDSAFVGFNKASSDIIDMRFVNKALNKVIFINDVAGKFMPPNQVPEEDKLLRSFLWQNNRRPKSKFELFGTIVE
jgi:lipopolysaccharide transport protein LptA